MYVQRYIYLQRSHDEKGHNQAQIAYTSGADPEGVVWGAHTGRGGGTVMLGLFLVFVKPIC